MKDWRQSTRPGRLYERLDGGRVRCLLSPRNCEMREGQSGFCKVRVNSGGELHTLNYGKAVNVTEEQIETEAVFHYAPGARILSLGNIGCMLHCAFCQNWSTSQARYLDSGLVREYTPEQIVELALKHKIPILSWTYNDPVVWHEFVMDTARLAHEHGIKNLYKSAFFISMEGARELCEVIDIFSISLKTMDPKQFGKLSGGRLAPVLEATKAVYDEGKHVEISNLMITDANDTEDHARAMAGWVQENLSADTPLHFVRFHPDYKYTHVERTPVERLFAARKVALDMGIHHCYVGNVYDTDTANTFCHACGALLLRRYGLNTWREALTEQNECAACGATAPIKGVVAEGWTTHEAPPVENGHLDRTFDWRGEVNACHVELRNGGDADADIVFHKVMTDGNTPMLQRRSVARGDSYRFVLSKAGPDEQGFRLLYPRHVDVKLYSVYDRAHLPTVEEDEVADKHSRIPFPHYEPRLSSGR